MKRWQSIVYAAFLALAVTGCSDDDDVSDINGANGDNDLITIPEIVPDSFTTVIDNPYLPLTPGDTLIYLDTAAAESIVVAVTDETVSIMGVDCRVVHDRVFIDGELVEDTRDFYAQHVSGTVLYFGEESQDLENGVVISTEGSWKAGEGGATPGILMLANPNPGDAYKQENSPGVAEDEAMVVGIIDSIVVPAGTYRDVLVIEEINPLEPGVKENKYYAPNVGLLLEEAVAGETGRAELVEKK